jgi:hypothetical protein
MRDRYRTLTAIAIVVACVGVVAADIYVGRTINGKTALYSYPDAKWVKLVDAEGGWMTAHITDDNLYIIRFAKRKSNGYEIAPDMRVRMSGNYMFEVRLADWDEEL